MAFPSLGRLRLDERALVARLISNGLFKDEKDFEEFAVRRAVAQFQLEELWDLQKVRPPLKLTMAEIVKEVRKVRRAVARKHSMGQD